MPNHTHLIAVPQTQEGLRKAVGEAHRRYSRMINFREGWRGYLWQGRFSSFVMDERYLLTAVRYIELNPVGAGLLKDPAAYPWSSARSHIDGRDDKLVSVSPLLEIVPDWKEFIGAVSESAEYEELRRHERTGRPLGDESFIERLEALLKRRLQRGKPGPKGPGKHRSDE